MKKPFIFLLITLSFLLISTAAEAANWKQIAETSKTKIYIDTTSISESPNGPREAGIMFVEKTPDCTREYAKNLNKCIAHAISYQRHFSNKTFCSFQSTFYFTDETNDGGDTFSCNPRKIVPGSATEIIWEYLYQ